MPTTPKKLIFLLDQPQTCSMLFRRLLSQHPQLHHIFHPFRAATMYGPERIQTFLKHCGEAEKVQREYGSKFPEMNGVTYGDSIEELVDEVERAEELGKVVFVKEHLACVMRKEVLIDRGRDLVVGENPTRLPDEFLHSMTHPIFLIRHPLHMVRSFWEMQASGSKFVPTDDEFFAFSTLKWTVAVYEYFVRQEIRPIVIDGEDIVQHTEALMQRFCEEVRIDPGGVVYEWAVDAGEGTAERGMRREALGTLRGSTGVQRAGRLNVLDLEAQREVWEREYGESIAGGLVQRVEEELPLYDRLKELVLRV